MMSGSELRRSGRVLECERPRVLHVVGSLTLGGIETWLMHMLRNQDRFDVRHEVLVTKEEPGAYEPEARTMGIPIHTLPLRGNKTRWFSGFKALLRDEGPFAAVHSHGTPHFTAPVLAAAQAANVPIRIAHSHSARSQGSDYPLKYRLARRVAMLWLRRIATRRIGITEPAVAEIAGRNWRQDPLASVLIYGFDFGRNIGAGERAGALRRKVGIAEGALVVGSVARLDPVKNHAFLLKAFAVCAEKLPHARLVLVGTGPLKARISAQAEALGLADQILFAGTTGDVPAYMAMFDLFALPSFSEGLGIVCVEAQAAGTRCLVSETTPAEASVVPGGVEFLSLAAGAARWGEAMERLLKLPSPDSADWLQQVEQSKFGIRRCIDELNGIYLSELERIA